jgi:hypothetical protein
MKLVLARMLVAVAILTPVACSATSQPTPAPPPTTTPSAPTSSNPIPDGDPFDLISLESLFAYMGELTAIQPYSGWRNSGTEGEAQALDYVAGKLGEFGYLQDLGLELERQSFRVFMTTELWETHLHLTVDGKEIEVPADGIRGNRDDIARALRFDSDGTLNDLERNPVVVEGPVILIRSAKEIGTLSSSDLAGKVALVSYVAVDPALLGKERAAQNASDLLSKRPAGVVLVTHFSNEQRASHGSFVGDGTAFYQVEEAWAPPTLYVRLEDLSPAGIEDREDLPRVESARLTWDADVSSPGTSGNLVARIPGLDPSRAVILGAHIDSPNGPGAMDDGSGSVVLLEVARVLDAAQVQPPTDLYLVWFGSEELGLYGSYHFVSTHQELLDRTIAMLQIDGLSRPLDGIQGALDLVTWSYGRLGDGQMRWPDYLTGVAKAHQVGTNPVNYYGVESDNTGFAGFGVPNANLIFKNDAEMAQVGPYHYAAHIHDPYDTVELARDVDYVLEEMARVALVAALETGRDDPDLRVSPQPDRRALFIASHTESVHMSPTTLTDMGMTLVKSGFDVDLIPYGQVVTSADLEDADLVVALPVVDYPSPDGDLNVYDEAWSQPEIDALEGYVADGGLLVLTNSAYRLKYGNQLLDRNEDWEDVNALAERFGVSYREGMLSTDFAVEAQVGSTLVEDVSYLAPAVGNDVPFTVSPEDAALAVALIGEELAIALVDYGQEGGQVLALTDLGLLGAEWEMPPNLTFWQNLADYARTHRSEAPDR